MPTEPLIPGRSGHSLLNPPKPIDLSQARTASLALDLDFDLDDEEAAAERQLSARGARSIIPVDGRYEPIFQDDEEQEEAMQKPLVLKNGSRREELTVEDQEVWDRLG